MPVAGHAGTEDQLYRKAMAAAKAGQLDFAFMYYNQLDREYPRSRYRDQVLFVKGEYYYQMLGYAEAVRLFQTLLQDYPDSGGKLFALVYLYKMAEAGRDQAALEEAKKEILTFRQVGLIFKESKEYKYQSAFRQDYLAVFRIDKVEFYKGGELFATVSY
ncbi:MAG: tetratricopeptide repeat protein [Candidatus Omnitrophica bacterium]|nr:tetratricopeptide repeat protein [Candidatus Omnitrophota bacterium]